MDSRVLPADPRDLEANPRLLASVRVAIGLLALAKGLALVAFSSPSAIFMLAWIALAFAVTVGWYARFSAGLMTILGGTMLFQGYYGNHFYLLTLVLLLVAVSDCERHYAIRPRGTGPTPGWPLFLMRAQLSIVYLFAGLAKINADFLSGRTLAYHFDNSVVVLPDLTPFLVPVSVAAVAAEVFIGIGLWSRKLRPLAFALLVPVHIFMLLVSQNPQQLVEIGIFAATMFVLCATHVDAREGGRLVVWDDASPRWRSWIPVLRRMDVFGTLSFARRSDERRYQAIGANPGEPDSGVHVFLPGWRVQSGSGAVREVVEALPGGVLLAPYLALPGLRDLGRRVRRGEGNGHARVPSGPSARPV